MQEIYRRPLRVYVVLAMLTIAGIVAGLKLPISLFPNSSQPVLSVSLSYGDMSAEEFQSEIGSRVESEFAAMLVDGYRVEHTFTDYRDSQARFRIQFEWGTNGQKALREVRGLINSLSGSWPDELRKSAQVNFWNQNSGFLAISYFSPKRTLEEVFEIVNPLMKPGLAAVQDAEGAGLWNPQEKSVEVSLDPEKLASYRIFPSDVEAAVLSANRGVSGGSLEVGEGNHLNIFFPRVLKGTDDIGNVMVKSRTGRLVQVKDIATVRLVVDKKSLQSFKTNGVSSLILFASPRAGGNIKRMSDEIMSVVEKTKPLIPEDIEYKILVNPSEFINASISGVLREVGLAAFLAVVVLFIFIGSLKNVITAAIEIPMSMVLAFLFMKLFNMNLNLISLGGLALSAGMNVDASVVVMENIFRHFEGVTKKLNFDERLAIIVKAVNEVKAPIISSTVASLVVFIPLIATHGLTNAILGDLAKAVVFSHALSAVVALVLVPTIRLQLMSGEAQLHPVSPIEGGLSRLENFYSRSLEYFLKRKKMQFLSYGAVVCLLVILTIVVLPRLQKEIVGRPETDWIILGVQPQNFTEPAQLNNLVEKIEFDVLQKYDLDMQYTFTQLHGVNDGMIMIRLKSKKDMDRVWKSLEAEYSNTPETSFWVQPWNPSELSIPNPPHLRVEVRGGTASDRSQVTHDLRLLIQEGNIFPSVSETPGFVGNEKAIVVNPLRRTLFELAKTDGAVTDYDLGNMMRIATQGKLIATIGDQLKTFNVQLKYPPHRVSSIADLKGLPIGVSNKILPLSALASVIQVEKPVPAYIEDQSRVNVIEARQAEAKKANIAESRILATANIEKWKIQNQETLDKKQLSVKLADSDIELNQAIDQLKWAIVLSIGLIFITMVLQFGDIVHALLVLIAVPLGIIGVLASLWIFSSNLSLNSVLGVILLNGIAVANSVILVDFMKRLVDQGESPIQAAVHAARVRLRPIIMTSLTTILGMTPIAFGMGEGGKILQPLGIAVAGGLWVSMLLTLFLVPSMQVNYMQWKSGRVSGGKNKIKPIAEKFESNIKWNETPQELQ